MARPPSAELRKVAGEAISKGLGVVVAVERIAGEEDQAHTLSACDVDDFVQYAEGVGLFESRDV